MMINRNGRVIAAAIALTSPLSLYGGDINISQTSNSASEEVDTLLINAQIKTPTGWAQAMAIDEGRIIAVGGDKAIKKLGTSTTEVIDLSGQVVLPGFHDLHVHPLFAGILATQCSINQGSSLEQVRESIAGCVAEKKSGEWITGGQWDASSIGAIPHHDMIDDITPDNPLVMSDTSGHSALANSKGLEIAGITTETPDPEGGIIERDEDGNPTGVLRESAIDLVKQHVPAPEMDEMRAAMSWATDKMLAYGITSFIEASAGFVADGTREVEAYTAMADEGLLKQRVRVCMTWEPDDDEIEKLISARNLYSRDRLSFDCLKFHLDGVPTDSHTAAMLEPYANNMEGRDDEASRMGMLLMDQGVINEAVTRFDAMGMTVKFHSAGDAAVRAGLEAIGAARQANGFSSQLHDVGHCTFVAKEDMEYARSIGATFEMSPYLWSPSPINDDITAAVGAERIQRVWPLREAIDSGALVVPGSDWAVVPSVNPWLAIEALVTRERPGGSTDHFGRDQAITVAEAIQLFTENSAKHMGREDELGRIEPGMLADLVVIDNNPYEVPKYELHKISVTMTIIEGEQVFVAD